MATSAAAQLAPIEVAPGVFAVVGDLGSRTRENDGANANYGFIIGGDGVLLINTGPSAAFAQRLVQTIRGKTDKPIRLAVNLNNSQSHYWWGNGVLKMAGARIYAHPGAISLMNQQGGMQRDQLAALLGASFPGPDAVVADQAVEAEVTLDLGDRQVRLLRFGPGHSPRPGHVAAPRTRALRRRHHVRRRLLAVLPVSNTAGWLKAFRAAASLDPRVIVPGHGHPAPLSKFARETADYLEHVRTEVRKLLGKVTPSEAADRIASHPGKDWPTSRRWRSATHPRYSSRSSAMNSDRVSA